MNINPKNQNILFGYKNQFNEIVSIFKKNKFPNKVIFSGKRGIGKCTLSYHFCNYIFSQNEENKYNIDENKINKENHSFKLIQNNSHPNFFLINLRENKNNIDIAQIRQMIDFTRKSSFNNSYKIILIDNVEFLSQSSTNALLKIIEEPNHNIIFLLIYDNSKEIFSTLKSRCIEFKLFLNNNENKQIVDTYFNENIYGKVSSDFNNYYNTPSSIINFYNYCINNDLDFTTVTIEDFIKHIIKNYSYKSDNYIKNNLYEFIELFFSKKILFTIPNNKILNFYDYFVKRFKIFKNYNLDFDSYLIEFNKKLLNE